MKADCPTLRINVIIAETRLPCKGSNMSIQSCCYGSRGGENRTASCFFVPGFAGWQVPLMVHPAHPHPQDVFPFLLLFTILAMTAATMITKITLIIIVAIFPTIHVSIKIPPVTDSLYIHLNLCSQSGSLFIRSEQHIDHTTEDDDGGRQTDGIQVTGEGCTNLVDHQCHRIS